MVGKTVNTYIEVNTDRSAMDELILSNARKSINEIAEITSLPANSIAERLARLLEEKDHLSARQEERLLLIDLYGLWEVGKEKLENAMDKDYAGIYRGLVSTLTQMSKIYETRSRLVNDEISQITSAHGRLFGEAFDIALSHIIDGLKEQYPEIDETVVDSLFDEGMFEAKKRLEKNIV